MGAALCGHMLYLLKDKKEHANMVSTSKRLNFRLNYYSFLGFEDHILCNSNRLSREGSFNSDGGLIALIEWCTYIILSIVAHDNQRLIHHR